MAALTTAEQKSFAVIFFGDLSDILSLPEFLLFVPQSKPKSRPEILILSHRTFECASFHGQSENFHGNNNQLAESEGFEPSLGLLLLTV